MPGKYASILPFLYTLSTITIILVWAHSPYGVASLGIFMQMIRIIIHKRIDKSP